MTIRVTKTAVDPTTARAPTLFYESARAGMRDFLEQRLAAQPGLQVLLPSFIGWSPHEGSGVFDPVRELDLAATFYRLHGDLSVDERISRRASMRVGRPSWSSSTTSAVRTRRSSRSPRSWIATRPCWSRTSRRATAWSGGPAARFGGVLMYSLHKMFPTPESRGGMVTYRDTSLVTRQASTRPDLAAFLLDYDWREIGERRRAHYVDLERRLRDLADGVGGFDLLWPDLSDHDIPQTLPVRIQGSGRDEIYTRMNAEGFGMVSLYHTLIPELRENAEMMALSRTVINFPVHQDMHADQREALVASFCGLARGSERRVIRSLDPGADREAWLDAWRATGREPFAHPDYVALFAEDEDTILALLDEQPTGSVLLPLVRRRLPDALGAGSDAVSPYGYGGPFAAGTPDWREFYGGVLAWMREAGVVSAFVRASL